MLDRPRREAGESIAQWRERREGYVALHRRERNRIRTERIVNPVEMDEEARQRIAALEAAVDELRRRKPSPSSDGDALTRAEGALANLREAAGKPSPPSSVDDLTLSPRLRALLRPGEPLRAEINRLSAALRLEFDEVNNLTLTPGGSSRILDSGKTAGMRHSELSELLNELAELGAQMERR